jgi:Tol biopolymer transport system component
MVRIHNRSILLWLLITSLQLLAGCGGYRCTSPDNDDGQPHSQMLDFWPKWCPADSNLIAYTHLAANGEELQHYGERSIWIVDTETLETEFVTEGVVYDWAPDGAQILFWRSGGNIWLVDISTGTEQCLPVRGSEADFSPCGRRISFHGGLETTGTWVFYLDSMEANWISAWGGADWHPDGTRLLCDSLVVISDEGQWQGKVEIDYAYGGPWLGRWSPSGDAIAYGAYCDMEERPYRDVAIWVVSDDGTRQSMVVCPGARASWSPDGRRLAYGAESADGVAMVVWTGSIDGSNKRQITFP